MEAADIGKTIAGPMDVLELVRRELKPLERETIKLLSLDHQNRLINCETIAEGAVDITLLRPRDVFERALRNQATFIVLVHNHPSGGPEPSESDVEITRKIAKIGKMIGVWLQDHIIVGGCGYTSLRSRNVIPKLVF